MSDVVVQAASVTHGSTLAVDDVTLTIGSGELVAVLGPSGCGKTSLLLALAGLLPLRSGTIAVGGRELSSGSRTTPPEKRSVGWVPQEASLFPHLTVGENIGFALPRGRGRASRIAELAELVGLGSFTGRAPNQLSGGQAQRVALARALASKPDVLLLDEPFAALDTQLRTALRREVAELLRAAGTTSVLVTHDQEEALTLADRVAVMRDGRLEQYGTPEQIYQQPANDWVAGFVGDVVEVEGRWRHGRVSCTFGNVEATAMGFAPADGDAVRLMLRPEWIVPRPDLLATAAAGADARVASISYAGHDAMLTCDLTAGSTVRMRMAAVDLPEVGESLRLAVQRPGLAFPAA